MHVFFNYIYIVEQLLLLISVQLMTIVSFFLNADAVQNGWSLDAAAKMLTVTKQKPQTNQKLDASKLQRLTECVFHLEH
jgi:hypothetical protein